MELTLNIEASRSRSGKHAKRSLVIVHSRDGDIRLITDGLRQGKQTYSHGFARIARFNSGRFRYLVYVSLVKNSRGKVKGFFEVYDSRGRRVLRAILKNRKIRRSCGDPHFSWLVEDAVQRLGLGNYVRKVNMTTGTGVLCE